MVSGHRIRSGIVNGPSGFVLQMEGHNFGHTCRQPHFNSELVLRIAMVPTRVVLGLRVWGWRARPDLKPLKSTFNVQR